MSKPKVFLSYSHADAVPAKRIAEELGKIELHIWLDEQSLQPGKNWVAEISRGLEEAGYLLLLLSQASLNSQWVQHEWTAMLTRQLGSNSGGVVIPVRLEKVQVPALLKPLQHVDLFPDFEVGLRTVVGFFLSETRPAWLVQDAMQKRSLADLARSPELRAAPEAAAGKQHGYSGQTVHAWRAAMDHAPLSDVALQQLDSRTIRLIALRCVSLAELLAFCLDTETDRGSLEGTSLNLQILSLLEKLKKEGRLEEFIRWLANEAPRCVRAAIGKLLPRLTG